MYHNCDSDTHLRVQIGEGKHSGDKGQERSYIISYLPEATGTGTVIIDGGNSNNNDEKIIISITKALVTLFA